MNRFISSWSDDIAVVLEGAGYLLLCTAGAVAFQLNWISMGDLVRLAVFLLFGLLILAWKRFDGGRHPYFLFLLLLLLCQAGRLIGYTFGYLDDPFQVTLQTPIPFDIPRSAAATTLLLIMLSAICVYLPCRWRCPIVQLQAGWEQRWRKPAYLLFWLLLPALIWKNYRYFDYIRSHGNYLVVFTDSEALKTAAGPCLRMLSLLATNAFTILYLMERKSSRSLSLALLFTLVCVLELLIGFRGKFFLLLLTLWFIHNLKTGKKFRLPLLLMSGVAMSVLGLVIADFREDRTFEAFTPIKFVSDQGVPMYILEAVIAFRDVFKSHALPYLFSGLAINFTSSNNFPPGTLLGNDLSVFLCPEAFSMGYSTSTCYLAELYLLGGIVPVLLGSLAIGMILRKVHQFSGRPLGALVAACTVPGLIYLPRLGVLDPVSQGIKSALGLIAVLPLIIGIEYLIRIVRLRVK